MDKNNRVVHFEIHAVDPNRLAKFYKDVFDWEIKEWSMPGIKLKDENRYWGVMTAPLDSKEPGINGGIVIRKGPMPKSAEPVSSFVCTIGVSSVDKYLKIIKEKGGTVALPKMAVPKTAWLAYCKDPEGNIFGIYEDDKNAMN